MKQPIHAEHWLDSDGHPQGGITQATGLLIAELDEEDRDHAREVLDVDLPMPEVRDGE